MKKLESISVDEWQAAVEEARATSGAVVAAEGVTVRELVKANGHSDRWWQAQLRELVEAGRVVAGRAPRSKLGGGTSMVLVYRLLPVAKKK